MRGMMMMKRRVEDVEKTVRPILWHLVVKRMSLREELLLDK